MNPKILPFFFLIAFLINSCAVTPQAPVATTTALPALLPTRLPTSVAIIQPSPTARSSQQAVLDRAFEVVTALQKQDFFLFSTYIHPVEGIRFSPYSYVEQSDLVFSAEQVKYILADSKVYDWGEHAATGEPVNLSFLDYFSRYIYDVDFATAPQVSLNHRLGGSTAMDNIAEFYPSGMIVEYYFPGFDPQLEGMDWRSLRLVFTPFEGSWYVAGLVHESWTP